MNTQTKSKELITLLGLAGIFIILFLALYSYQGFTERVELRRITILKTKYEIIRLKCGDIGGEFIEKDWSVKCNK
ncbi:hypothetical protein M0R04_12585 [Candidatus Dojkabacteria bacterium]|jgi:hypothetical protein|nr:hypothetical protein [Candidatus Dojkabacteria bacterium]